MQDDERSGCPRSHRTDKYVEKWEIWCIQTAKQAYYVEILKQLHETVCSKRPELQPNN